MNIKQTIRNLVLGGLLLIPVVGIALMPSQTTLAASCGGVETSLINCNQDGKGPENSEIPIENTGVWGLLILIINIMSVGVGILAVAGFVYGAILYTSAGGSPENVKKARSVLTNVVIGVVAYGAMFTLLNFIVPGGVFN